MCGSAEPLEPLGRTTPVNDFVGVKAPMFSFTRLLGADPVLGVEMASTGEVATFGEDKYEAILTSMRAANFKFPKRNVFLCIGPLHAKLEMLEPALEQVREDLGVTVRVVGHAAASGDDVLVENSEAAPTEQPRFGRSLHYIY